MGTPPVTMMYRYPPGASPSSRSRSSPGMWRHQQHWTWVLGPQLLQLLLQPSPLQMWQHHRPVRSGSSSSRGRSSSTSWWQRSIKRQVGQQLLWLSLWPRQLLLLRLWPRQLLRPRLRLRHQQLL